MIAPSLYATTMGRLQSAASSVAVPEATSTTSAAASALRASPSSRRIAARGACMAQRSANKSRRAGVTIGAMHTSPG